MRRARYSVRGVPLQGFAVLIKDMGPWDMFPTVTNDAEGVLADLISRGYVRSASDRIAYYDSEGELAEILHDGCQFKGFGPVVQP